MTAHDVIEDRVTASRPLRWLTAGFERAALRGAEQLVAMTDADAQHFAAGGRAAKVIPNPVDLAALNQPLPGSPREVLAKVGVVLPERHICLFVGSAHPPNLMAVERLRRLGAALSARLGEAAPLLVVAGAAAPPGETPGFLALGQVETLVLRALYGAASLALIPLPEGTGSSLKTLEAMGAGLPVLGTSVAFRGLALRPGDDAVVEDNLAAWDGLVPRLLADPGRLRRVGEAGRKLAGRFDRHLVMAAYLPLLGIPTKAAPSAELTALAVGSLPRV